MQTLPLGLKIEPSACYLRGHLKTHCTAVDMQGTVSSIYSSRLLMCQNTLASHKYTVWHGRAQTLEFQCIATMQNVISPVQIARLKLCRPVHTAANEMQS